MVFTKLRWLTKAVSQIAVGPNDGFDPIVERMRSCIQCERVSHVKESRVNGTTERLAVYFNEGSIHITVYYNHELLAVKKSWLVLEGGTRSIRWNTELAEFGFDGTDNERSTVHSFLQQLLKGL